jgi:hypothetical protein
MGERKKLTSLSYWIILSISIEWRVFLEIYNAWPVYYVIIGLLNKI